jgi:plasmid stability protein
VSNVQVKSLDPEVHHQLRERAAAAGVTISDYVLELIRRDLRLPSRRQWLSDIAALPGHDFSRDEIAETLRDERASQ